MKTALIACFFISVFIFDCYSQQTSVPRDPGDVCKNIIVYRFACIDCPSSLDGTAESIRSDVINVLTGFKFCQVLRRDSQNVLATMENREIHIGNFNQLEIKMLQGERILFGNITHYNGIYSVNLEITNLFSLQIERSVKFEVPWYQAGKPKHLKKIVEKNVAKMLFGAGQLVIDGVGVGEYTKLQRPVSFGIGMGFQKKSGIMLSHFPTSIKLGRPHADDLGARPGDVYDQNIQDNYLVWEDTMRFHATNKLNYEFNVSIKNFLHIGLRYYSSQNFVEKGWGVNLYSRNYIKPEHGGEASVYYCVNAQEHKWSLPLWVTYPLVSIHNYTGLGSNLFVQFIAGTNILLSPSVDLTAEKGWFRYNSFEVDESIKLGKVNDREVFLGFGFNYQNYNKTLNLSIKPQLSYSQFTKNSYFRENFDGIVVDTESHFLPSVSIDISYAF